MNAHTDGPWVSEGQFITGPGRITLAEAFISLEPEIDIDAEANARLIAAAPDMYEALVDFIAVIDDARPCSLCHRDDHTSDCPMIPARAVIAKATGGAS